MKKKKSTPTPHDAVFRQLLSQPDVARDFMEIHLPPQLLALCDLSTLRQAKPRMPAPLFKNWHSGCRNRRSH